MVAAKETPKRRRFKIKQKQKRRQKIKKLKAKYLKAKTKKEKERIIEKILRIAPHYPIENILKLDESQK
ncbi:MAG TPA: hypothetical protein ENG32_00395 [bacterium]|nr:hypothetical protein [bacterium]